MALQTSTNSSGACRTITPNDGADLPIPGCRAIYVGGAGNISIVDLTGTTVVFTGVLSGGVLPVQAARVNATSTTATSLIALY
jgi:hypothetical protein